MRYLPAVRIIAKNRLRDFWARHHQAENPLKAWYATVRHADWKAPTDIKAQFDSADFVGDNRVIFDIAGNKYRLIVYVAYKFHMVLIKWVGTHKDYDKIDPEKV